VPKLTRKPPAYSLHKPSGQARVRYQGRDHYLGPYGSRESREAYARLLAEISRDSTTPAPTQPTGPIVADLILRYWAHAQTYYRHPDGKATGEHLVIRCALKPLRKLYGSTPAGEFRARDLRLLRDEMIRLGWSRRYVNDQVGRIKRFFAWCAAEELIPEAVPGSLLIVKGLEAGRSKAREKAPVRPVADATVDATLPHLPPIVADVVRVLRLSGARIGEILTMTAAQLDRADPSCWVYTPARHKTAHKGKSRVIHLGSQAVAILTPRLVAAGGGRILPFTRDGVRQAIANACKRHGIPHWHPHQLRHAAATEIRRAFGLEAAQVVLGHSEADTTQTYAEADAARAREVMKQVG
jgi:integrase